MMKHPFHKRPIHAPQRRSHLCRGHRGMVGSALVRQLERQGYRRILTRTHAELDLIDQRAVGDFSGRSKSTRCFWPRPEWAASTPTTPCGRVHLPEPDDPVPRDPGGVLRRGAAAALPGELLHLPARLPPADARGISAERLPGAHQRALRGCQDRRHQAVRVLQPAVRHALSRGHATNLYGPNDNFDLENSHVLPALLRKFHLAKLAGQGDWEGVRRDEARFGPIPADVRAGLQAGVRPAAGGAAVGHRRPRREFLHVDDMAAAASSSCSFPMSSTRRRWRRRPAGRFAVRPVSHINIGAGEDISIRELSDCIRGIVGFEGGVPGMITSRMACPASFSTCRV